MLNQFLTAARAPRWTALIFLMAAAALNYADRSALSAVLPPLKADLNLSDTQLGLISSVFLWCYSLASPVVGGLADRYSRRRLVLVSILLWSVVSILTGWVGGLISLLLLRSALGLLESIFLPAAIGLLAEHHGTSTRGTAMSLMIVGMSLGVVIGGVVAGALGDHLGWRYGFWTLGAVGIAFVLIFQPFLKDVAPTASKTTVRPGAMESVRYLLGTPTYCILVLKAMLASIAFWVFFSWLPLYFKENFDLSLSAAGFMGTFMLQGASIIGTLFGGYLSDAAATRFGTRWRMLLHAHAFLATVPFLLIFLTMPGIGGAVFAVSAFSLFCAIGGASEFPLMCDVVPGKFRSTAVGFSNAAQSITGGFAVLLTGVFKSSMGLNAIFASLSAAFLVASLMLYVGYFRWTRADVARAEELGESALPVPT